MKFSKHILTFSFLIFFEALLLGQNQSVKFKHITVDNGLSQSWVRCITQDKTGFLWVGTDNGLNRYDGYNFVVYKPDPKKNHSLIGGCIMSIFTDSHDNVWIGTYNGLNLYDRKMDRFVRQPNWPDSIIKSIFEDKNQNVYICSGNSLFHYNLDSKKWVECKTLNDYLRSNSIEVSKAYMDKEQNIWIAAVNKGLILFRNKQNSIVIYKNEKKDKNSISDNYIRSILEDNTGRLWIGTRKGLDYFTNPNKIGEKAVFKHFQNIVGDPNSLSEGAVISILDDNRNNLWVGTENGGLNVLKLKYVNNESTRIDHFVNVQGVATSLSNNSIYSIFQDVQGNIWIGTFGNGLNIFDPIASKFEEHKSTSNANSISNNHVNTFFEEDDYIWIGTEGGLNRITKKDGVNKVFRHNPKDPSSLGADAVWSIYKDKKGNLWIGTWAGGLNKFDYKTESFKRYLAQGDNTSVSNNNIFSIAEDNWGNLWIGTVGGGLNYLDQKTGKFSFYSKANSDILGDYIEGLLIDQKGNVWLENSNPLGQFIERFDRKSGKFKVFSHNSKDSFSLSSTKVNALFEDSKGHLWIGTDDGLNLMLDEIGNFKSYNIKNGLPDNSIRSILEDDKGNLWLGTNKGISKFVNALRLPENPEFNNYTIEDGLQGYEFVSRSSLKARDGKLYFGGINGYNSFYPDSMKHNTFKPNVVITDFLLFNQPIAIDTKGSPLKENINFAKEITLTHNQSVFSFRFAAISYTIPEKNQYAYIMEGFDNQWNYVKNKREATYTNLNPGNYIFRVKASNNDGVWNENGVSITLIIKPPWWKTIWFRMLMMMMLLLSILLAFYVRTSLYRKRQKELQEQVLLRTKEFEKTNLELLKERVVIQEQSEELRNRSEELKKTNVLLLEKQEFIQKQSEKLEETNKELYLLNATKDKFFSIIAHDLRNPFHAVSGFSELLLREYKKLSPEKVEKFLSIINAASRNGYTLLDNLLQWTHSQTGHINYDPECLSLKTIVTGEISILEALADQKSINLVNNVEPGLLVVADANMLKTIIRNLISNAIKFTNTDGQVLIKSSANGTHAKVTVMDNGVGISKEKIGLLFNFDTNISTRGTSDEKGTGLGLLLCKEFVERNGGQIWVESEVNVGSKFSFTLQLA